jgi:phosphohistidine phosphatase
VKLAVIRHAIAEDREAFAQTGKPDEQRPLTAQGRRKMRKAARGICRWLGPIDLLASSPLVRAKQTAELIAEQQKGLTIELWPELAPESSLSSLLERLRAQQKREGIAVVSHRPLLPKLVCWLLTGKERPFALARKGSVFLLEFPDQVAAGKAILLGAIQPVQLRAMARAR